MPEQTGTHWAGYLSSRIGQLLLLLAALAAILLTLSLLNLSYQVVAHFLTPEWIGLLLFAYFAARITHAVERIADNLAS